MKKVIVLSMFLSLGLVLPPSARATAITVNYTLGNQGTGSGPNSIVRTISGETITATGWGLTGNNNTTFQTATVGQYSGYGLGICNQIEMASCGSPQHEVDDNGQMDFVMFSFSPTVTSVTITIDPVCNCDTNASYWVGNGLNPLNHTLAAMGAATASNETTKDTVRSITITNSGNSFDTILFGASISGNNNYFKVQSLSVNTPNSPNPPGAVPEPATFGLAGIALLGIGFIRRKSR